MNELKELRDFCEAVPSPAPSRLTTARDRLEAAMAREADTDRPVTPGHLAALFSRRRWPGWAAPLAAAVAMIAVIAGTYVVVGAVRGTGPAQAPAAVTYPRLVCVLSQGGIVTILRDGRPLALIHVKASGDAIAVTPDGKTAYIAATRGERRPGVVIPIQLATGKVLRPIPVGVWPNAISVTANGRTVYASNFLSGTVTPIATNTNTALAPIKVGSRFDEVVVAPDGRTLYVSRNGRLTPVSTATGVASQPVRIPGLGLAAPGHGTAVTPDSKTVYAVGFGSALTPIQRDHALNPIAVPKTPESITIAPDGRTAYVVSKATPFGGQQRRAAVTTVDLANGTTLPPLTVAASPNGWGNIAIAPGEKTAYFTDTLRGLVTPIDLATHTVDKPISSGKGSFTVLFGHGASMGYLIESQQIVPLNTATNTTLPPIKLPTILDWGEAVNG
jgi:DNA-binding beta-propeller fold protein YncE